MPNVRVNGVDIHYEARGPEGAPAILLAHSLFFDHRMFEHQLAYFADRYRVVAYDQRGHGGTPHPADGRYDMDTLAEDAAGLIEGLKLGPSHVVGNSMGGFVTLRLAARRPDLVRSVTAAGSSAEAEYKADEYQPLVQALKAGGGAPVVDTLMYTMFGDTTLNDAAMAPMRERWRAHIAALPTTIGDAAEAVVGRLSVLGELPQVRAPLLAIAGAEDHAYTVELSENLARAAVDGRCVVIERAGHSVSLERHEAANRHLEEHFRRADLGRGQRATVERTA